MANIMISSVGLVDPATLNRRDYTLKNLQVMLTARGIAAKSNNFEFLWERLQKWATETWASQVAVPWFCCREWLTRKAFLDKNPTWDHLNAYIKVMNFDIPSRTTKAEKMNLVSKILKYYAICKRDHLAKGGSVVTTPGVPEIFSIYSQLRSQRRSVGGSGNEGDEEEVAREGDVAPIGDAMGSADNRDKRDEREEEESNQETGTDVVWIGGNDDIEWEDAVEGDKINHNDGGSEDSEDDNDNGDDVVDQSDDEGDEDDLKLLPLKGAGCKRKHRDTQRLTIRRKEASIKKQRVVPSTQIRKTKGTKSSTCAVPPTLNPPTLSHIRARVSVPKIGVRRTTSAATKLKSIPAPGHATRRDPAIVSASTIPSVATGGRSGARVSCVGSTPTLTAEKGFSIISVVKRRDEQAILRNAVRDVAEFYTKLLPPRGKEANILNDCLARHERVAVGQVIVAARSPVKGPFGANDFVADGFLLYRITQVNGPDITLQYVTFSGGSPPADPLSEAKDLQLGSHGGLILVGELAVALEAAYPASEAREEEDKKKKYQVFDDHDGKFYHSYDRSNIEARLSASRFARRVIESDMYEGFTTNGIDFDASRAWKLLEERGWSHCKGGSNHNTLMLQPRVDNTSIYFREIEGLPCASSTYFATFMSGRAFESVGDIGQYLTGLQDFHQDKLDVATETATMRVAKLREALANFEAFLIFSTGMGMKGVFDDLRKNLFNGNMHDQFWLPRYLRYVCENCVSMVFKLVNTEKKDEFRQRLGFDRADISTAIGVQYLLRVATADLSPSQEMQTRFEREYVHRSHRAAGYNNGEEKNCKEERGEGGRGIGGVHKVVSYRGSSASKDEKLGPGFLPCKAQLLHDLGIKNMEGKVINACSMAQCKFKHIEVNKISKRELHAYINDLAKKRGVKKDLPAVLSSPLAAEAHTVITQKK